MTLHGDAMKIVRKSLPAHICRKIEAWRNGFTSMPQEYIDWHRGIAEIRLEELSKKFAIRVHSTEMISDGWLDGMRTLRAIVETKSGNLLDLKYNDSNQDFMKKDVGYSAIFEDDFN